MLTRGKGDRDQNSGIPKKNNSPLGGERRRAPGVGGRAPPKNYLPGGDSPRSGRKPFSAKCGGPFPFKAGGPRGAERKMKSEKGGEKGEEEGECPRQGNDKGGTNPIPFFYPFATRPPPYLFALHAPNPTPRGG